MTDRFKHVQRPIMINDCDVSIKEPRDSPSLSLSSSLHKRNSNVTDRFVSALILSVNDLRASLPASFSSSLRPFRVVYRWEEKGGRSKGTKERRTMTRCHVCGER